MTIYCTACNEKVTMRADYSFACGCQGPIELRNGGDPMPETWRGHQMDAEETELFLLWTKHKQRWLSDRREEGKTA